MKAIYSTILLVVTLLIMSCAAKRVSSNIIQQDSVNVEVRERVDYVLDTIEVEIPSISETVSTRDTMSHLENEYATSEAMVSGGILHHSLSTKPHLRQVAVKTPRLRRDSIVYRNFYRDVEVEIERELSWLQKTQINGFWGMLVIIIILIILRWAGRE